MDDDGQEAAEMPPKATAEAGAKAPRRRPGAGSRGPLKIVQPDAVAPGAVVESAATRTKPEAPPAPEDLEGEALRVYGQLVESLDAAGMAAGCDGPALVLASLHFAIARKAADELSVLTSLAVQDDKNDRLMKHPAHQIMRDHSAQFLAYAREVGATYVSRARTPAPGSGDEGEPSPFEGGG